MKDIFRKVENPYSLRNMTKFKSRNVGTVRYGIETSSCVGPRIWDSISSEVQESSSLGEFRTKIRRWTPENCPCKFWKTYV